MMNSIYDPFATAVAQFAENYMPQMPVSYPDIHFDPPDSGFWLELISVINTNENYGTAASGPTIETGFFRIVVTSAPGAGIMAGQQVAWDIVSEFPKGSMFGPALVYRAPSISSNIVEDEHLMIPVTIYWRSSWSVSNPEMVAVNENDILV